MHGLFLGIGYWVGWVRGMIYEEHLGIVSMGTVMGLLRGGYFCVI